MNSGERSLIPEKNDLCPKGVTLCPLGIWSFRILTIKSRVCPGEPLRMPKMGSVPLRTTRLAAWPAPLLELAINGVNFIRSYACI
jgi:hypothetical protein